MAELYDLKGSYDRYASSRCCRCDHNTTGNAVKVMHVDGHLPHYVGLQRCGLVWECPTCSARIKAARAGEVRQAVEWHTARYGRESALLVTLTIRHQRRDDLEALRRGLAVALRRFQAGKGWRDRKAALGFVGSIAARELTHSDANGWHPHLHVVFLLRRALDGPAADDLRAWMFRRWARCVAGVLGAAHAPLEHDPATGAPLGVDVRRCHRADYLAKLGLEVASPNTKQARGEHRTPLQILADFADAGTMADLRLYRAYVLAMKGARQLTWSKGLKAAAGITERTDEEIAEGEQQGARNVALIARPEWAAVRWMPGAKAALLEMAERWGADGVYALLDAYLHRPGLLPPNHRLLTEPEMLVAVQYAKQQAGER